VQPSTHIYYNLQNWELHHMQYNTPKIKSIFSIVLLSYQFSFSTEHARFHTPWKSLSFLHFGHWCFNASIHVNTPVVVLKYYSLTVWGAVHRKSGTPFTVHPLVAVVSMCIIMCGLIMLKEKNTSDISLGGLFHWMQVLILPKAHIRNRVQESRLLHFENLWLRFFLSWRTLRIQYTLYWYSTQQQYLILLSWDPKVQNCQHQETFTLRYI